MASSMGADLGFDRNHKIVVIGVTGAGKSTLCNVLVGKDPNGQDPESFFVSAKPNACTFKTMMKEAQWLGTGPKFTIIDTPGLDDADGRDTEHIAEMVSRLIETKFIHAFLIIFNGQNPRLDGSLRSMLRIFSGMFGNGFLKNAIIAFSRWSFDSRSKTLRKKNGTTEDVHRMNWNKKFREQFGCKEDLPIVFVDAHYLEDDKNETIAFQREVNALYKAMSGMKPYECKHFDAIKAEFDQIVYEKNLAEVQRKKAEAKALQANEAKTHAERKSQNAEMAKERAEADRRTAEYRRVDAEQAKARAEAGRSRADDAQKQAWRMRDIDKREADAAKDELIKGLCAQNAEQKKKSDAAKDRLITDLRDQNTAQRREIEKRMDEMQGKLREMMRKEGSGCCMM